MDVSSDDKPTQDSDPRPIPPAIHLGLAHHHQQPSDQIEAARWFASLWLPDTALGQLLTPQFLQWLEETIQNNGDADLIRLAMDAVVDKLDGPLGKTATLERELATLREKMAEAGLARDELRQRIGYLESQLSQVHPLYDQVQRQYKGTTDRLEAVKALAVNAWLGLENIKPDELRDALLDPFPTP